MSYVTLAKPVSLSGPSLLSANASTLTLSPAASGSGYTIARTDAGAPTRRIGVDLLVPAKEVRTTSVVAGESSRPLLVNTIEHVLSALYGMGITDIAIGVDGESIPIFDGSSKPIVAAMEEAGIVSDGVKPKVLTIDEPILIQDEKDPGTYIEMRPRSAVGSRWRYDFITERPVAAPDGSHRVIEQSCIWEGDALTYAREISPARTFSFKIEADAFTKAGMFAHFTPRDLLVIDDVTGHPIQNMYRYKNELARHKLIDLVGDLALVGRRLQMDISSRKAGHALNHLAAKALAARLR